MNWMMQLTGEEADLAPLTQSFTYGDIQVSKEDGKYLLASARFEELTDANDVKDVALIIVAILNGVCRVALNGTEPIGIGNALRRADNGKLHTYLLAGTGEFRRRGIPATMTAMRADSTVQKPVDSVKQWASLSLVDQAVAKVMRINALGLLEWANLYRVLEIIADDVGGFDTIEIRNWMPRGSTSRLKWTANSADILGLEARHGIQNHQSPPNPMTIGEARRLVRALTWHWLESKS